MSLRIRKIGLTLLTFLAFTLNVNVRHASAADGAAEANPITNPVTIIDLHKSLPMEPEQKATRDFYINAGTNVGIQEGMYVDIVRSAQVNDPAKNQMIGSLNIPIGRLRIIHAEKNVSVGRIDNELNDQQRPVVDYEAVMIGDHLDLASLSKDKPKDVKKSWF